MVLRDALYWVPLSMITLGVRPEEILQLKVKNVRRRDGIICIFFGDDLDDAIKTEQSRRILPVPELLLRLGFKEWIVAKRQQGEVWAFPDIQPDASHDRRSQIFGGRMRTLLEKLELRCEHEDIYAMRRTLSSKLLHLGVDTGIRQRVLGHLEGTTVDRHYSDHGLRDLKVLLDRVDYGIEVGPMRGIAFPVIIGCTADLLPPIEVLVALSDRGDVSALRLCDPDTDGTVFAARIAGTPDPKSEGWDNLDVMTAREAATRVNELLATHSAALPAREEAVAAFEHLLIVGDLAPSSLSVDVGLASSTTRSGSQLQNMTVSPHRKGLSRKVTAQDAEPVAVGGWRSLTAWPQERGHRHLRPPLPRAFGFEQVTSPGARRRRPKPGWHDLRRPRAGSPSRSSSGRATRGRRRGTTGDGSGRPHQAYSLRPAASHPELAPVSTGHSGPAPRRRARRARGKGRERGAWQASVRRITRRA